MNEIEDRLKKGYRLSYEEAVELARTARVGELSCLADALRTHFQGNHIDTCSIMNARSGRCTENCKWCSQSKFHTSEVEVYPLVEAADAVTMARHNAGKGVRRFSLVTSGRGMTDAEVEKCCRIYEDIARATDIYLCASMGLLTRTQLQKLYGSGVRRYHCNLETAPSYFPQLCTTHTVEDKIRTIRWAQEAGMEVCSGGIIGMGETLDQRVELAVALRDLGIKSIPVNMLNPIAGTALERMPLLDDDETVRSVAMFRIVNPDAHIRFAGGRALYKNLERRLLHGGVNASIVGDMLTTSGSDIESDFAMFTEEGFRI